MSGKREITQEKARRIAIGATAAGVLLIVFLVVVLIVQFVKIGVGNARKDDLDDQIAQYNTAIDRGEKDLDWYRTGTGLYWYARTYGYT